jgi:hypothetical protein
MSTEELVLNADIPGELITFFRIMKNAQNEVYQETFTVYHVQSIEKAKLRKHPMRSIDMAGSSILSTSVRFFRKRIALGSTGQSTHSGERPASFKS